MEVPNRGRGDSMDLTAVEALDRTTRLINADYFNDRVADDLIVQGLTTTTVRISATEATLAASAGQHVVVTLATQRAMCGIGIALDFPDVDVLGSQPPLHDGSLR